MLAASALNECLLELALQRNLAGFQQSLKKTMDLFALSGWAVIFPATPGPGSRPVFMAHGIRAANSPLLTLAAKDGIEAIIPAQGMDGTFLATLARQISPLPNSSCRVLRTKRDKGGEFILFCFRPPGEPELTQNEMMVLSGVARLLDRCFLALAQSQEQEFEAGLFRLVGNLHPDGLCVLDNRLRVLFENRKFKEQMHVWSGGMAALQNLSLPRQSELPPIWKEACERSFKAFREVKFPPISGRMAVTQGSLSEIKHRLDGETWLEGAVRYLAFQSPLGVRPYLILTCTMRREQRATAIPLARICERLGFSRREGELAELILQGSSASEIASRLKIALPTVKTHIRHILQKAGVKTRLQFVGLCRPQN